ncbi:MAG: hypothetical protein H0X50_01115 [Nitrosopumilus sp.]|nr:hypothetical protein [Nitrosopumilus sp.]
MAGIENAKVNEPIKKLTFDLCHFFRNHPFAIYINYQLTTLEIPSGTVSPFIRKNNNTSTLKLNPHYHDRTVCGLSENTQQSHAKSKIFLWVLITNKSLINELYAIFAPHIEL